MTKNGTLKISIPSKKNWVILLFCLGWLVGWYWGLRDVGIYLYENLQTENIDSFTMVWMVAWLIGGSSVLSIMLWSLFGREKITLKKDHLVFQKTVFGFGRRVRMSKTEVKNFRMHEVCSSSFSGCHIIPFSNSSGKIRFDYGMRTYCFGLSLDQSEVRSIICQLENNMLNKYGFEFDELSVVTI